MNVSWTSADRLLLQEAGISLEAAERQLRLLREGVAPPLLLRAATRGDGIESLDPSVDPEETAARAEAYQRAASEGRWVHFIPASGAATRLGESLGALATSDTPESRKLRALLGDPEALKSLPKALMPFHEYEGAVRTPVEEHIREAAALAPGAEARLHFTIAPEHEAGFLKEVETVLKSLRKENIRAEVTHSFQDASTQTLALESTGEGAFRDGAGNLVLRPGGHGSLLQNLESVARDAAHRKGAAFAWIRNIDNIPVEPIRAEGRLLRRALGGLLMQVAAPERPTRVAGMVKNTGEPGGGPFWVGGSQGAVLRIVESAEVSADPAQQAIFRAGTHFNPVDLAVSLRNRADEPFRLEDFADPAACFIADKKHGGRALKALEWPGLWNGAMAHWETHCVEIPLSQFAPVKTVTDLLRPEHRG